MDLTPVVELPQSSATTPGVAIPDRAKGLCHPIFSPAMTPTSESVKVLSPTAPTPNTIAPQVLLRKISLSADNLPGLCLNDCPMAVTPVTQLGNHALGTSVRSPMLTTHHRWSIGSGQSEKRKETSAFEKSRLPAGLLGKSEKRPPTLLPQDQLSMWSGHDSGYSGSDARSSSTKARSSTTLVVECPRHKVPAELTWKLPADIGYHLLLPTHPVQRTCLMFPVMF